MKTLDISTFEISSLRELWKSQAKKALNTKKVFSIGSDAINYHLIQAKISEKQIKYFEDLKILGETDRLKLLKLEVEYIHTLEKETLQTRIKKLFGQTKTSGTYTLAECGMILDVSRERARQLEDASLKLLKHPNKLRIFREYLYNDGEPQ